MKKALGNRFAKIDLLNCIDRMRSRKYVALKYSA